MGTRCLTYVYDASGRPIVNMYRQFDGYPSGHGAELAEFLDGMKVVNGLSMNETGKVANGMGCLAAQIVAHFKTSPGGIYIYSPIESRFLKCGEDYVYHVSEDRVVVMDYEEHTLFDGSWKNFGLFCNEEELA